MKINIYNVLAYHIDADVLELKSFFGLGNVVAFVLQTAVLALEDGQLLQSIIYKNMWHIEDLKFDSSKTGMIPKLGTF